MCFMWAERIPDVARHSHNHGKVENLSKSNLTRLLVITALVSALTGCLSQEKSNTSFSNDGGSTQNAAPQIWGSPPGAVMTGNMYSFTPAASDADGDALSFSIANKPQWANFSTSTGRLSGQPVLGDEGMYANIRISVSDGSVSSSLPDFSVEVTQTALGSMTLSWTPPTENDDGSQLTDLAGYKLYYGTSPGNYTNQVRIDNPGISVYVIDNLLPDTYYVVATAFNATGDESSYSNMAVKTVTSM